MSKIGSMAFQSSVTPSFPSKSHLLEPKHPLLNRWTLWYFMNDKSIAWEKNQVEVNTFQTVEDFWATMNHINPPSGLNIGCDYSLFKAGIKPMWEDPMNKSGGRWIINIDTQDKNMRGRNSDRIWMETLLAMVGETLDDEDSLINGAIISIRPKANKVCLWIKNSLPAESITKIGKNLKSRLGAAQSTSLYFELHEDTKIKSSSSMKITYRV